MTSAEEIKSRLDVVSFIQGYLKLTRAGINFKARCPFHSEKTPSFFVSPSRETWKCFGCGKGGDIFNFVMEMENIDFPEALRLLAERTGVKLRPISGQVVSEKTRLFSLMEDVTDFFEKKLEENKPAMEYLKKRGLREETIKEFRLGFSPDSWTSTSNYLRNKGYTDKEIERVGLVVQGRQGFYDRFRSRIIFPFINTATRVIGFGGRIFEISPTEKAQASGKYINSPQTILYDKSKFLYAFDKTRQEVRRENKVIAVEGQMDAIMAWQAGTLNVVAVSGTALTEDHIIIIKRFCDEVSFAFDMDSAGIAAAKKAVALASEGGITSTLIELEKGKDPADIVVESSEKWKECASHAQESIGFFLSRSLEKYPDKDAISKRRIGEEILPLIAKLTSEIELAHWIQELSVKLGLGEDVFWKELLRIRAGEGKKENIVKREDSADIKKPSTRRVRLEERILGLLFLKPELIAEAPFLPKPKECFSPVVGKIFAHIASLGKEGIKMSDIMKKLDNELQKIASQILFETEIAEEAILDPKEELILSLNSWKGEYFRSKLLELEVRLKEMGEAGDEKERAKILEEIKDLSSKII
ncbi:DNA primase [Patescibacteria group bacterium]